MRYFLYSNDEILGWSELIYTDPPMGCVRGSFYPNDNYKKIQPLIREMMMCDGTLGELDEERIKSLLPKKDALNLNVRTESGENLEPDTISIEDWTGELEEEEDVYHLHLFFLPRKIFEKYFER